MEAEQAVRQRKMDHQNGINGPSKSGNHVNEGATVLNRIFLFLVSAVTILIVVFVFWGGTTTRTSTLEALNSIMLGGRRVYAVIIDAGSTGSRVLAFTFKTPEGKQMKLEKELFVEVKPGLSSFADNPEEGAKTIEQLLERAKEVIPEPEWKYTPLTMKATAGLRLLPREQADALLSEVAKVFKKSGFLINDKSVSIMDGVDEGLFSWFTVNFLLDKFSSDINDTVAALDLGGGSTQVTFATRDPVTLKGSPEGHVIKVPAFQKNIQVYTHSYLGLGLMAARKEILSYGNADDATELKSICINPIVKTEWNYNRVTYTVRGSVVKDKNNPVVNFAKCRQLIQGIVSKQVHKPTELNYRGISAFSYYFDRATESGLIDPFEGGTVTIKRLINAANSTCAYANVDQPFMCLDLTFISVLLNDGFGLKPHVPIHLHKKINGFETSWALGAAFNLLESGTK